MINLIGMTGNGATCVSTYKNAVPNTALAIKRPHMSGCDHGSSSVSFKLKPKRSVPIVPTKVVEPRKSILRSLSYVDRLSTSEGSFMFTLSVTSMKERARIGICDVDRPEV